MMSVNKWKDRMNKKVIIGISVLVVVIAGALAWSNSKNNNQGTNSTSSTKSSNQVVDDNNNAIEAPSKQSEGSSTVPTTDTSSSSTASNSTTTGAKTATITYLSGIFTPGSTSISVGDSVQFTNSDPSVSVNIASGPHPIHNDFTSLNLGLLAPGKTSSAVKFEKVGTFSFHNHSNPSQSGTITVK